MFRQAQHEGLSKDELIELVLKLQRPGKTSRTSSKPPSTDRKEWREQSRPDGAKPGHESHSCVIAEDPDTVVDHRPSACPDCGLALSADLPTETVSAHERIELPKVKPLVEQHRRLAVVCPGCRARVAAPRPTEAASTPFGPRLHATALYPENLPGPVLRAPAEGPPRLVRPTHQPGRPDQDAAPGRDALRRRARCGSVIAP